MSWEWRQQSVGRYIVRQGEGLVTLTLSPPPFIPVLSLGRFGNSSAVPYTIHIPVLILWAGRVRWLGFGACSLLSSSGSGGSRMWKVYCYSRAPGTRPGTFNQNSQAAAAAPDPVPAPQAAAAAAYQAPQTPRSHY